MHRSCVVALGLMVSLAGCAMQSQAPSDETIPAASREIVAVSFTAEQGPLSSVVDFVVTPDVVGPAGKMWVEAQVRPRERPEDVLNWQLVALRSRGGPWELRAAVFEGRHLSFDSSGWGENAPAYPSMKASLGAGWQPGDVVRLMWSAGIVCDAEHTEGVGPCTGRAPVEMDAAWRLSGVDGLDRAPSLWEQVDVSALERRPHASYGSMEVQAALSWLDPSSSGAREWQMGVQVSRGLELAAAPLRRTAFTDVGPLGWEYLLVGASTASGRLEYAAEFPGEEGTARYAGESTAPISGAGVAVAAEGLRRGPDEQETSVWDVRWTGLTGPRVFLVFHATLPLVKKEMSDQPFEATQGLPVVSFETDRLVIETANGPVFSWLGAV